MNGLTFIYNSQQASSYATAKYSSFFFFNPFQASQTFAWIFQIVVNNIDKICIYMNNQLK